ncbi:MAG TPA: dephospho-CoA kinase [Mucilaginibacter sp.]|nr:dephospho-CoA kinase [Mucilaginibacter sp.]
MLKVGITGNIGSGKTTVSKIFEVLGIPVFYADDAAKEAMVTDHLLISGIRNTFGSQAYFEDGTLNRKYIANIVFNNDDELNKLNALVHPATFRAFDEWLKTVGGVPYILKEAAVLFESGSFKLCDYSIMVSAPLELRIKRVMERDGLTREQIISRESRQFDEEKKSALADFIIVNDEVQMVIPQALELHQKLCSFAGSRVS